MNRLEEIKKSLDEMNQSGKSSGIMVLKKVFDQYGIDLVDSYTEIDGITFIKSTISHEDKQYEVVFYQYTELFEEEQYKIEITELASKRMASYKDSTVFKSHLATIDFDKDYITSTVSDIYAELCYDYDYEFEITDELINDIFELLKDIDFNEILSDKGVSIDIESLYNKYPKESVQNKKLMSMISNIND